MYGARNIPKCKLINGLKLFSVKCSSLFPNGVGTSSTSKDKVNGKPIEVLSEIECEVQLKLAIEKEDYDLADKIRKRMEKFR